MNHLKLASLSVTVLALTVSLVKADETSVSKAATGANPVKAKPAAVKPVKKKRIIKAAPAAAPKTMTVQQAEPAKKTSRDGALMAWLKELRQRVAKSQVRQNQIVAVAAVRGNETPDSPPLYWKGKKTTGEVEMPELKEFEAALDAALSGDTGTSKDKLKLLVANYPESPLAEEAQETLAKLEAETPSPE